MTVCCECAGWLLRALVALCLFDSVEPQFGPSSNSRYNSNVFNLPCPVQKDGAIPSSVDVVPNSPVVLNTTTSTIDCTPTSSGDSSILLNVNASSEPK